LSSLAALLGIALAHLAVRALVLLAPEAIPRSGELGVDGVALALACALALLTGLGFGLAPALGGTRFDLSRALQGGRSVGEGRHRLRGALVVAQVAVALVLLIGAGLLGRSFLRL